MCMYMHMHMHMYTHMYMHMYMCVDIPYGQQAPPQVSASSQRNASDLWCQEPYYWMGIGTSNLLNLPVDSGPWALPKCLVWGSWQPLGSVARPLGRYPMARGSSPKGGLLSQSYFIPKYFAWYMLTYLNHLLEDK